MAFVRLLGEEYDSLCAVSFSLTANWASCLDVERVSENICFDFASLKDGSILSHGIYIQVSSDFPSMYFVQEKRARARIISQNLSHNHPEINTAAQDCTARSVTRAQLLENKDAMTRPVVPQ
jgi:hypothetical protein